MAKRQYENYKPFKKEDGQWYYAEYVPGWWCGRSSLRTIYGPYKTRKIAREHVANSRDSGCSLNTVLASVVED